MQQQSSTPSTLQARIAQLEIENKKQEEQIQELVHVNATWDKYTHDLKNDHERELAEVMSSLNNERKLVEEYKDREKSLLRNPEHSGSGSVSEESYKKLMEQKEKAVNHAISQTKKVDDFKQKLQKSEQNCQDMQQKIQYLEKAVKNLRTENGRLREIAGISPSQDLGLSVEPDSDQLKKLLSEKDTQIAVLKQQIAVFKEDFDSERKDREKAQQNLTGIHTQVRALQNEKEELQRDNYEKTLEVNALRETRDEQRVTIERLEKEARDLRRILEPGRREDKYNVHIHTNPTPTQETARGYEGFLTKHQKDELRKHYSHFISSLRTEDLSVSLFAKGVISFPEKQDIDALPTSYKQSEYIFTNVFMKATQSQLKVIQEALLETEQSHLAELIPVRESARIDPTPRRHEEAAARFIPGISVEWKCDQCTFANRPESTLCAMCGNSKDSVKIANRGIDQCDFAIPSKLLLSEYDGGDIEEDK